MNELMLDRTLPRNAVMEGRFDPSQTGGLEAGWRARRTIFEMPPLVQPGQMALDRMELEIWWTSGDKRRTFTLDGYRPRILKQDEIPNGGCQ